MKKKYIYVIVLFIVFNILLTLKPVNNIIQSFFYSIQDFITVEIDNIAGYLDYLEEQDYLIEENKRLNNQVDELNNLLAEQQNKNIILEEKNKNLSNTLKVNPYKENEYVMANILNKKTNTNLNILTIDKGQKDGIKKNQIVSYDGKMIGYIDKVEENQSDLMLLKNENVKFNIPVSIYSSKGKINATISSYDAQANQLLVKPLTKNSNIEEGNKVYTNRYSQSQAADVYVGEINEIIELNSIDKIYGIPLTSRNYEYVEVVV